MQPSERDADRALAIVSCAVLLASSTWFTGTAAAPALREALALDDAQVSALTTSVQIGFISGTLIYALFNVADVLNPRHVFCASALLGALANALFARNADSLGAALTLRFFTGLTLAGVYPVGMKIIATWFAEGLGWRLGVLVGALTLGTASPYLLRSLDSVDWRTPCTLASGAAVLGGLLMLTLRDGPHLRRRAPFDPRALARVFEHAPFRHTAFAYFGHMWELYALWALAGAYLSASLADEPAWRERVPLICFALVAVGALGCAGGGWLSRTYGERRVAMVALAVSCSACLLSGPMASATPPLLVAFLLVWGVAVVADSPQFSALAARHAPPEYTATALTVQNGLGFAVTVVSLQLLPVLAEHIGWKHVLGVLAIGPLFGLASLRRVPSR